MFTSVQETSRVELLELEKEKLQLRRELQEAVDAKKQAEANASKYDLVLFIPELLVTVIII